LRSHVSELLGEAAQHGGTGKLELGRPSRVVDRDEEFAVADELRVHLTRNFGTDDVLPAAGDAPEHKGVLHAALT
jgi:hypothetical protein